MKTEEQQKREKQLRTAAAAYGVLMADREYSQVIRSGFFPPSLRKELLVTAWKKCLADYREHAAKEEPNEKLFDMDEIPWRLLADKEAREALQPIVDRMIDGFISDIGKASSELGTDPAKQ